ncbi:hypothetical protein SAMN06265365_104227 [Tistlia consotensis]|uniref:Uncharacterized protein n=1 Tax=Tistlia consotensis USBA 355 TaxID=560819 RepID=A0A1Y6BTW0_9PROT|nr:hypothetical protein [Tistlia consotensis]SMF20980.1 hypothetical protein SAMN05428998_10767 [Tistlia consotensis USBA 355]SNR47314.1 hypothetical protein SAMN06265365_104227 [Tistlia consotensis]
MSVSQIPLPAPARALRNEAPAIDPISLRNALVMSGLALASWGAVFGLIGLARSGLALVAG